VVGAARHFGVGTDVIRGWINKGAVRVSRQSGKTGGLVVRSGFTSTSKRRRVCSSSPTNRASAPVAGQSSWERTHNIHIGGSHYEQRSPPRYPLVRLAGVLGPRSSWRAAVVARAHAASSAPSQAAKPDNERRKLAAASSILAGGEASSSKPPPSNEHPTPNAPHTSLGSGVAKPVGARIDWPTLIRRVYLEDVLRCRCGGRRHILAHIEEPDAITAILEHLHLPTEAPPIARARSPGHAA
jgi:hypothetical protein